jgi:DnaJ-class molecular chaperone
MISVKIPPGIEDGKNPRPRPRRSAGRSGTPGDIVLTIHIQPHTSINARRNLWCACR